MQSANLIPFIPPHIVALGGALLVLWILVRWGDIIFFSYALWLFWHEHAVNAVCYILLALFFGAINAGCVFAKRCQGHRASCF